ncbi:MAG: FAD binding domain-containing protein [Rhodothalassiaceae bacterium]
MHPFAYHRVSGLDEARATLGKAEDGLYLAGGMTLIPTMKQGLAMPSDRIDLAGVDGLAGIAEEAGGLRIGAMTPHAAVAASDLVRKTIPALADLAGGIGDPAVRARGTLGGSIANNDPAADYPAAVLGLAAMVVTGDREIAADDFFTGMFETALAPGEIITAVRFPAPKRAAYVKFPNPASRYAVVGVFVAETGDGVRVAVTGAAPGVFRVTEMEAALAQDFSPAAIADITVAADDLNEDIHASRAYRAHLVTVMAKRAVERALAG